MTVLSIDELVDDYLVAHKQLLGKDVVGTGANEFVEGTLHPSSLGYCHRRAMLSLLGKAERKRGEQEARNRRRKFELANHVHNLVYAALKYASVLVVAEKDLTPLMPKVRDDLKWSGRLDFVANLGWGREAWDIKSQHPNAMRNQLAESLPKKPNMLQVGCYRRVALEECDLCNTLGIFYQDRGGGNSPKECRFPWTDDLAAELSDEMELMAFDAIKAIDENELPAILPKLIDFKSYQKQIVLKPNWQCNEEYCDFAGASCKPLEGETGLAELKDGVWKTTTKGRKYEEEIDAFLTDQLGENYDGSLS
jgi:hypothetical protein